MKKLYLLVVLVVGLILTVVIMRWIQGAPKQVIPVAESGMRVTPTQVPSKTAGIQPVSVSSNHAFTGQFSATRPSPPTAPVHQNSAQGVDGTQFRWNGPTLSPQMESALGIRKSKSQDERWSAIHGLSKTLPPHEIDALIQFLEDKTVGGPDEDIRGEKNDILEALIEQEPQAAQLQGKLLSMFRDKSHEEWWRNFCVQHFELLYRKKWPNGATGGGEEERRTMKDAYSEAVREVGNSIAGTALLGMARLSEDYPEFDKKTVSKTAVNIAGNTGADPRSRIAALQVAGRLGGSDVLPVARSVAVSGAAISLRLSAISAISEVGTAEDVSLLSQISRADEPYLAKAASNALHRIESKNTSEKR